MVSIRPTAIPPALPAAVVSVKPPGVKPPPSALTLLTVMAAAWVMVTEPEPTITMPLTTSSPAGTEHHRRAVT